MTQRIPVITNKGYRQIKAAVHRDRDAPQNLRQRQRKTVDQEIPPAVIFLIPEGGIAARDGDTVTSAACKRYYLKSGTLTEWAGTTPLWNLSGTNLVEGQYVIGNADSLGQYIFQPSSFGQVLIKAPSGGIPQRVGTLMGSASCDVYTASTSGVLSDTTENITVWNWGTTAACANGDRYGWAEYRHPLWWVVSEDCGDEGTQVNAPLSLVANDTSDAYSESITTRGLFVTPRTVVYTPPVGVLPA